MAVQVVEVVSGSPESFEDAIRRGLERTSHTVHAIQNAVVKEQRVVMKDGSIGEFRVDMDVTVVLKKESEATGHRLR